jgi:hypothetical protein
VAAYDLTDGFDVTPASSGAMGSSPAPDAPGMYTGVSGDKLIWFCASGAATSGALPAISAPAGFTVQAAQVNTATGSGTQICALMADAPQYTAGLAADAIGALSASHGWAALLVSVSPSDTQAVTVIRSVNGVSKSHSAGDAAALWDSPVAAL